MSQEQLAEKVGISTTHMSHIETGNTKLSLQVLVDFARVLSVQTDELLFDSSPINKTHIKQEISDIIDSCSTSDSYILLDILRASKISLDKHR